MLRMFLASPFSVGTCLEVPTAQLSHIRARRLEAGEPVCVFNGDGFDAFGTLVPSGKRDFAIEIDRVAPGLGFAEPSITLAMSVIALDRMDWALQKCAELGVTAFTPIFAARSQGGGVAKNKVAHWQAVVTAAAEQCGRARVASVTVPQTLAQWLQTPSARQVFFCQMGAGETLASQSHLSAVSIAIGPEGGWTDDEIALLNAAQARAKSLGHATLRSETAAVAAVASIVCL